MSVRDRKSWMLRYLDSVPTLSAREDEGDRSKTMSYEGLNRGGESNQGVSRPAVRWDKRRPALIAGGLVTERPKKNPKRRWRLMKVGRSEDSRRKEKGSERRYETKGRRSESRNERKKTFARLESQCCSSHGGKYPSAAEMDEQKRGSWRLLEIAVDGWRQSLEQGVGVG